MPIPWNKLIRAIQNKQLLPVVGSALSTIADRESDSDTMTPLRNWLAPKLADALGVATSDNLNTIAGRHLMAGGQRKDIYEEIQIMIDDLLDRPEGVPSQALCQLASITDFDLFITSSFDPFLAMALEKERLGFRADDSTMADFHPSKPIDLPENLPSTYLYHILGSYNTYPDFAVWEEDYMEFICGLLEAPKDTRRHLFSHLRKRSLLLIGSPFDDWIVRFFLRVAKGQRLSNSSETSDYLAENSSQMGEPLIFYFDHITKSPKIIPMAPDEFVSELSRRWAEKNEKTKADLFLSSLNSQMELGEVFLSYSRDDLDTVIEIAACFRAAGIPVWLDRDRLKAGSNWENHLMRAVNTRASLFLSFISNATEGDSSRYVHTEREWAAQKHQPGRIFYLPIIIDDTTSPKEEPEVFSALHRHRIIGGQPDTALITLIKTYHQQWTEKGIIADV